MNRPSVLAALAVAAACTLVACEKKPLAGKFDKITTGMTMDEVERIMGKGEKQDIGGVSISGSGIAGGAAGSGSQVTYIWRDGAKEVTVTFQDRKMISKSKAGF